jgi:hypothetical protein
MVKTRVLGLGVFTMIPTWGSIHLGPHEKGKSGSKQDETQFITKKKWCFSEFAISFKLVGQIIERDTTIPFK